MTGHHRDRRSGTDRQSRGGPRVLVAAWLVGLSLLAGACGPSTSPDPTGTPSPVPTGLSGGPAPTTWPTLVVQGAIDLAAADAGFAQMNKDVSAAVDAGDPQKILTVMKDALRFLKANRPSATYLQEYDTTKATGDKIAAAYDQMIGGAQAIVDGSTAGNGEAVTQGFNDFFAGEAAYAEQTGPLGDLAAQAVLMKRSYTK